MHGLTPAVKAQSNSQSRSLQLTHSFDFFEPTLPSLASLSSNDLHVTPLICHTLHVIALMGVLTGLIGRVCESVVKSVIDIDHLASLK